MNMPGPPGPVLCAMASQAVRRIVARASLAGACALCSNVLAQVVPDPTRPPAIMPGAGHAETAPAQAPQLQSVLLGPGRRPAAVINGELVMVGGRFGQGRLVRLDERHAVLQGTEGQTTLLLTPLAAKAVSRLARGESP